MGTHGFLDGDGRSVRHVDFRTGEERVLDSAAGSGAHGGGDQGLVDAFLDAVGSGDPGSLSSDAAQSLATHRVVWAAEEARRRGAVISLSPGSALSP
jgi:hypothetical protein